jgi:hypothetical protein
MKKIEELKKEAKESSKNRNRVNFIRINILKSIFKIFKNMSSSS